MNNNEIKEENLPKSFPPQHQIQQPGMEYLMHPQPIYDNPNYVGTNKLKDKVALITGGDSGIGRAVAIIFAKEGANIAIAYYNEDKDAEDTRKMIEDIGQKCLLIPGNLKDESHCQKIVNETISNFNQVDILVNNAAVSYPQDNIEDITLEQLDTTFKINVYSFFHLTKAVLPHLKNGSTIINTTSVVAFEGSETLLDYSATKGAIVSFTRSLAKNLISKGVRVNGIAPGPIWTPLQPASAEANKIPTVGSNTLMKRAGQPFELAPAYVYLGSSDSSYVTGQIIHINGGQAMY